MVEVDPTGKATFTFRHAGVQQVFLVGDFCRWRTDQLPMRQTSDHEWQLMMRLPPGTYEFRYLADGTWHTDYAAFGVKPGKCGDLNGVVRVPRHRPAVAQPARIRIRRFGAMARSA